MLLRKKKIKLETQLFELCKSLNYNVSLSYQKMNDYSVEVYQGYNGDNYKQIYFTDGHLTSTSAIKNTLKYVKKSI